MENPTWIVVLDANSFWTEQIYSHVNTNFKVLLLKPRDIRGNKKKYGSYFVESEPRELRRNVWELHLNMLPGWMFLGWRLSERTIAARIRNLIGKDDFVFVFNYPQYAPLSRRLTPALTLYYVTDDYSDHWGGRGDKIADLERDAVTGANVVICISRVRAESLRAMMPGREDVVHHVPIGIAEAQIEEQPLVAPRQLPEALHRYECKRPICGYIGALNWRFDYEFLADVAQREPHFFFILGGSPPKPTQGSEAWWRGVLRARSLPNIHFIGSISHSEISRYYSSFDVLFMTYTNTRFNQNACPAKLWDYLGTSLPIVSTDVVPEVNMWGNVVYLASSPAMFANQLHQALNEDRVRRGAERLVIARAHTWRRLANRAADIICGCASGCSGIERHA